MSLAASLCTYQIRMQQILMQGDRHVTSSLVVYVSDCVTITGSLYKNLLTSEADA